MDPVRESRTIYTVREISRQIKLLIEPRFPDVWVEGEVSNLRRSAAGHLYFTLKDDYAQMPAVCFRTQARYLRFRPRDGESFRARGRIGTYEARGEYQLLVEVLEPAGRGALQAAFDQLKEKLGKEGLFDEGKKRPLPQFPERIGIVTSPGSAALRDILSVLERRHSSLDVLIYPTEVQGGAAAAQLLEGVEYFSSADVDVVVLSRGGGAVEDLWPFNDEALSRAVSACEKPVVSAVGHETDFVMTDFVADVRAPTPSAAAELVVRTKGELLDRLVQIRARLVRAIEFRLMEIGRHLSARAGGPGFGIARERIRQWVQRVDDCAFRLDRFARSGPLLPSLIHRLERAEQATRSMMVRTRSLAEARLVQVSGRLDALSPLAVLDRGYAVCRNAEGGVIRSSEQITISESLEILLYEGRLEVEVKAAEQKSIDDREPEKPE